MTRRRLLALVTIAAGCGGRVNPPQPAQRAAPAAPQLPPRGAAAAGRPSPRPSVIAQKLDLALDPGAGKVFGVAEIELALPLDTGVITIVADGLELESVTASELDGRRSPRIAQAGGVTGLVFEPPLQTERTMLTVRWNGKIGGEDVTFADRKIKLVRQESLARGERSHDGILKLEGAAQRMEFPSGQSAASRPAANLA